MNMSSIRTRWAAVGAAVAVSLGAGGIGITHATISSGERAVFVALDDPCRLASTRPAPFTVGPRTAGIGPEESYTLDGWGAEGDCNLPSNTASLALNVTAVNATQQTNLRFFPADSAVPATANLNPTPGAPPIPNAVDVNLDSSGQFKVFNKFGIVEVVIDVMGYFEDHNHDDAYYTKAEVDAAKLGAVVNSDGTLARGTNVTSTSKIGTGEYEVIFNRDVTECVYVASAGNPGSGNPPARFVVTASRAGTANGVFFEVYSDAGTNVDMSFHVIVQC